MSFFYGDVKTDELKSANGLELQGGSNNAYTLTLDIDPTISANYNLNLPSAIGTADQYLKITDVSGSTANLGFATIAGGGSSALDDITEGDAASNLTTSAGDITIYSQVANIDLNAVNNISILPTTQSTTSTTGALIVAGGVGIAKNLNIGGALDITGITDLNDVTTINAVTNITDTTQSLTSSSGALIVSGGVGIAKDTRINGNIHVSIGATIGSNVDVTGNVNVSTNADITGTLTADGATILGSTLDVTGAVNLNNTTQSTSTTTGALIVDGGVGIAKEVYTAGNVNVAKSVYITEKLLLGAGNNELEISESADNITIKNNINNSDITFNVLSSNQSKNILQLDSSDNAVIATNMNTSNTFSLSQGAITVSGTGTEVLDFEDRSDFIITVSGSSTLTLASKNVARVGQQGSIIITQSSGTNSLTWQTSNGWYFPAATAPTLSVGNGYYDTFSYIVVEAGGSKKILVMDATNFQAY